MKELMMRDSKLIVNMSRGVTHKGLFSYVLPRFIAWILFLALTFYGLFYATTPAAHRFYIWLDNVNQLVATAVVCIPLAVAGVWLIWFRKK